ncbi:SUMF1/EgtB/PvdO family nonheme iron enzyme [Zavarzinella formosa]|uniref:SUMF1/EgtB/PvdO family nonheme iron enzyme n=1 Tax=Zavarzinella formosa TaxID=360055 RepID=UPI0002E86306|nr:SUMF1/EgtB/PvdO family nonheme iron enzyme [Zavarzinella formosa]
MIPPEFEYLTVEFEPEGNPRIPFEAGQVLENAGDLDSAATMYNRAFGLAPDDLEIRAAFMNLLNRLEVKEHGLTWRYIPGGVFLMGDNFSEPDERPWHPIWLKPYWVTDTCISWEDLNRLMEWKRNGGRQSNTYADDPAYNFLRENTFSISLTDRTAIRYSIGSADNMVDLHKEPHGSFESYCLDLKPYTAVHFQIASLLAHKLSTLSASNSVNPADSLPVNQHRQYSPAGKTQYGLPTEAQWEKAARGGLIGAPFPWGWEPASPERIDCDRFYDFGIKPMRSLPPNAYGLYGMSGGVWEWTSDYYDREFYGQSPREDPTGPDTGEERVIRGGSWADCPDVCTVSFRNSMCHINGVRGRTHLTPTIGFRLVRMIG